MKVVGLMLAIWFAVACSGESNVPEPITGATPSIRLEEALGGIKFDQPVALVFPKGSAEAGYVVEQSGRILSVSFAGGIWSAAEFLDIEARVNDRGREEGLLGLTLDPEFDSNGYMYVNYTASDPRRTVVSRFTVHQDSSRTADRDSEKVILEVGQPYSNHNGGHLAFGPDGLLYIGLGDGGSAGDPRRNGQNPATLLGSMVRIDVSRIDEMGAYTVPSDNPLVGVEGARPEVWAYGLRNPWRYSFDRLTGELWAADVGQNQREEINLIEPGLNYGWNVMEGTLCYGARDGQCDQEGLESPVVDYRHNEGCSVTGGFVYRGSRLSWLYGRYVYGDFCSGKIWALDPQTGQSAELIDSSLDISSFAEDSEGELYMLSHDGGVYSIVDGESAP